MAMELNWHMLIRQRLYVGREINPLHPSDLTGEVRGIAENVGKLYGKEPTDPTGQIWQGHALTKRISYDIISDADELMQVPVGKVYTSHTDLPDFSAIRKQIESDLD